jgi:hypothetical protein
MKDHRNFLLLLFTALQESRERQAALVLKRYGHLVGEAADRKARHAEDRQPATETLARSMLAS